MAAGILGALSLACRFVRDDRQRIPPTEEEISALGRGLEKSVYRRFNSLGAYDDLLLVLGTIGMYAHRAMTAPAPGGAP